MLKRSSFKRPAYVAPPSAPLVRSTSGARAVMTMVGDGCASMPKSTPVRSESHRRWVATLPCFACGIEGYSQAAHPNQGRGLGQKASDLDCFPLCCARPGHMGCHFMHDQLIDVTLSERRAIELRYIDRIHALAVAAGRREIA